VTVARVELVVTLALEVSEFTATVQDNYKASLASTAGVNVSDISLTYIGSSVIVTATIRTADLTAAQVVATSLSSAIADGASSSNFLGFATTTTPAAPTVGFIVDPAPSPPTPPEPPPLPFPPSPSPPPPSPVGSSSPPPEETIGVDDAPCFDRETTSVCRLINTATTPDLAYAQCFGSDEPALRPVAELVPMATLSSGDVVLAGEAATTRVVVSQHAVPGKSAPMITLHGSGGPLLTLTPDHVLSIDGVFAPARDAKPGSCLSDGHTVDALTYSISGIINPVTTSGTILAAHGRGPPILASTACEWSADIVLSSYPAYTLSFAVAHVFPLHVQQYYDCVLEPLSTAMTPYLAALKVVMPAWLVFVIVVLADLLVCGGFVAFTSTKLILASLAVGLTARAIRVRKEKN